MCLAVIRIASVLHIRGQVMLELLIAEVCESSTYICPPVLGFPLQIEEELVRH